MIGQYAGAGATITRWLSHLNGNSNDASGNGNNGADTGITYSTANGRFGIGAGFVPASSSKIQVGAPAVLRITGALTMSVWAKPASVAAGARALMGKWSDGGGRYGYGLYQSADQLSWVISIDGTNNKSIDVPSSFTQSIFQNVIATYTPSTSLILYKNGRQIGINTTAIPAAIFDNGATVAFRLGAFGTTVGDVPGYFYNGALDAPFVEGRAWTAAMVWQYYSWAVGRYAAIER